MTVFVDTSAFYAFLSRNDRDHQRLRTAFSTVVGQGQVLVATSYVIGETMGLVQHRLGLSVLARFVEDMFPLVQVRWVDNDHHEAAWQLVRQVNKRSFTIVDASSAALMWREGVRQILTLDPELGRLGFDALPKMSDP